MCKMTRRRPPVVAGLILAGLLLIGAPATAQTDGATPPGPEAPALPPMEAEDQAEVLAAVADFGASGFAGVASHVEALERAVDRAPHPYPKVEQRADQTIIRSDEVTQPTIYAQGQAAAPRSGPKARLIVLEPNTYVHASQLAGSYYNEVGEHERALTVLRKGLQLQPDNAALAAEAGVALNKLRRFDEALATYDGILASHSMMSPQDEARANRGRGFALTELGRLDEAEAAYKRALVLVPDDQVAAGELAYIARQRAAAPPAAAPVVTNTPPEAAAGQ